MSVAAIFGATLSCIFVVALWFNYHGPIPSQDTFEQQDKTEQTDEKSKDKSEQQEKSEEKEKPEHKVKSSTKKAAKKKADACVENCIEEWPLRSLAPWPDGDCGREFHSSPKFSLQICMTRTPAMLRGLHLF